MNGITINEPVDLGLKLADVPAGSTVVIVDGSLKGEVLLVNGERNAIAISDPTLFFDMWGTRVRILPRGTKIEFSVGTRFSAADEDKVYNLYASGQKIEAIKHVRTVTKLGLKDAKDMADRIGSTPRPIHF